MKESVVNYCARIGTNSLLVQGAGGNVSWKNGGTLWVKASGTWLSEAAQKDIFVPVDLDHIRQAISMGDFRAEPKLSGESHLRPSIETMLHALMPHPVVVHLHAIEILAYLVRQGFERELASKLGLKIRWVGVAYQKPGAELAQAVYEVLSDKPDTSVVFLESHGVVIGGRDVDEVDALLRGLVDMLQTVPRATVNLAVPNFDITTCGGKTYIPVQDAYVHQLATDAALFSRLASDWALYPDHLVFLGDRAQTYECINDLQESLQNKIDCPELVFIAKTGVFVGPELTIGKQVQLRCYYDVLSRQDENIRLNSLNNHQIADLLNWDAEKYRLQIGKK